MRAFFEVTAEGLIPKDEETRLYIGRRKAGQVLSADIKMARNYENHKRFFKFVDDTFDIQRHFEEKEAYRYWLTMKAGWFDPIVTPNGTTIFKARSIAFDEMEEEEFRKLFSRVIDVFLHEFELTENEINQVISYV
ncbi:MAG: DUF1367 family protein [Gammaproteobacteria bacterium]|nr:DUF1367 family protein [Gammaproteobacteria bacterium]